MLQYLADVCEIKVSFKDVTGISACQAMYSNVLVRYSKIIVCMSTSPSPSLMNFYSWNPVHILL